MHLTEILLDALAQGKVSPEFVVDILTEHAARTCEACTAAQQAHEDREPKAGRHGGSSAETRDPLARLRRRMGWDQGQLEKQLKAARRDLRDLLKLPPERRCGTIQGAYSRFHGPLFGRLLLDEARRKIPPEPAASLALAEAALLSAKETRRSPSEPEVHAAALAVRGNAKRALGRIVDGETDLEEAERLLFTPAVRDPVLPAEVHSYLGSLRKDQGRLDVAARHLHRAGTLYGVLNEPERGARILMTLSLVHFVAHDFDAAVPAAEEAVGLLAPESEAWLRAYAHYNLAHHLHARGEVERAEAELAAHQELLAAAGDEVVQHVVWLRARIAWSRGQVGAAERLYREARRRALERGIPFDAGLVALELALVHLAQGRTPRVKKLAFEALRVFAEQKVDREIGAALDLLEAAARRDALTRELLERAIAALERVRHTRPQSGQA